MHAPAANHSFVFFSFEFENRMVKYAEASSFAFNLKKVSVQSAEPIQNTKYKIHPNYESDLQPFRSGAGAAEPRRRLSY